MQFPFHCQERIGDPPVAFISYQDQAGRHHRMTTRGEHTSLPQRHWLPWGAFRGARR